MISVLQQTFPFHLKDAINPNLYYQKFTSTVLLRVSLSFCPELAYAVELAYTVELWLVTVTDYYWYSSSTAASESS